jgi:HNH endonuclease
MTSRNVPRWLRRAVEHRDGYRCTFPGCGAKRFVEVHHIVPWPQGPTDVANLMYVCSFHHDLLHQHGWHARLEADGTARWFRPDWTPYQPRPAPVAVLS